MFPALDNGLLYHHHPLNAAFSIGEDVYKLEFLMNKLLPYMSVAPADRKIVDFNYTGELNELGQMTGTQQTPPIVSPAAHTAWSMCLSACNLPHHISLSPSLSVCLSVFLSVCLSVFLSFCLSVFLSVCMIICVVL